MAEALAEVGPAHDPAKMFAEREAMFLADLRLQMRWADREIDVYNVAMRLFEWCIPILTAMVAGLAAFHQGPDKSMWVIGLSLGATVASALNANVAPRQRVGFHSDYRTSFEQLEHGYLLRRDAIYADPLPHAQKWPDLFALLAEYIDALGDLKKMWDRGVERPPLKLCAPQSQVGGQVVAPNQALQPTAAS